jgi:hypothetical protein
MKFEGTAECVATPDLTVAVNPASTLGRPPRVSGDPSTGRPELLRQIAADLALLYERPAFIARGGRT